MAQLTPFGDEIISPSQSQPRLTPFGDEIVSPDQPQPEGEAPFTMGGLGKSVATGVRGGLESIVSSPGDLVNWEISKVGQLAKYFGAGDDTIKAIEEYRSPVTNEAVRGATDAGVQALPGAATIQDITRHAPQNTSEEWGQTFGNFAPALLSGPAGWGRAAARTLVPTIATEGTGQLTRQLAPEWEDTARMVAGVLSGVGTEAGIRGGGKAMAEIGTNPAAVKRVQQLLRESGMSADDVDARMRELGDQSAPIDTGDEAGNLLRQEAAQIHARGGEGRATLDPMLRAREKSAGTRLKDDVAAAVGPRSEEPTATLEALKLRAQEGGKKQQTAHPAQVEPVDAQAVVDDIDSRLGVEKDAGKRKALQDIRESLHIRDQQGTAPGPTLDPSSEGLLSARQAIDNKLYKADGSPRDIGQGEAAILKDYRARINDMMEKANPSIRAADAEIHQTKQEERAFNTGREIYENPRGAPTEVEFKQTYDAMSPGEKETLLKGVNAETYRQLGITGNTRAKLESQLRGEGRWNTEKLSAVIGPEKAEQLMSALKRERIFQESYQKIVQGSKTAETIGREGKSLRQAIANAFPDIGAGAGTGAVMGAPGTGAMLGGLPHLRSYLTQKLGQGGPKVDAGVARLLASQDPQFIAEAMRALRAKTSMPPLLPALEEDEGARRRRGAR